MRKIKNILQMSLLIVLTQIALVLLILAIMLLLRLHMMRALLKVELVDHLIHHSLLSMNHIHKSTIAMLVEIFGSLLYIMQLELMH